MPVEDKKINHAANSAEFDVDDLMVKDFNDPHLNTYDEGPGSNLPQNFFTSNNSNRPAKVILRYVPSHLGIDGIKNLCNKYGRVKEVEKKWMNGERNGENVVVHFASLADAESAISKINLLRFRVNNKVMKANIYKDKEKTKLKPKLDDEEDVSQEVEEALNGNKFVRVEIPNDFHLPLAIPAPLPEPNEIDNQRMKILLETGPKFPAITNGAAIFKHSPDSISMMEKFASKSMGCFDEKTQQFVHTATNDFTEPEQCKNCDSLTIKFCKGCKDPFCSMYCLKEYNGNKVGCSCVSSRTAKPTDKKQPLRTSVGRGAKLLSHRRLATRSCSISSTDSDTNQDYQNCDSDIRVKPCDLPKNNKLVVITNVVSHRIVFLRSFETADKQRYLKYLNDVAEYAKIAQPLDEIPKKGDIVLTEYEGSYHRAWVARIENEEATVHLLELGNIVSTPVSNLKKLRHDLQKVQRFVFKASLSGMEGQKIKTDKCLIYLYELLERRVPLKFIVKEDGSSSEDVECQLKVSETNESVNTKLATLNTIKSGQCVMMKDIPIKPFDVSTTEAVVIDNSLAIKGIITVSSPAHMSDMYNMHQRIQEYCKEEYKSPYTPRVNEICLAKCNDQWYRAKLDKSFGDMNPVMLFIDFALFQKVNVDSMRRMPSEFIFPLYPVMAEIGGITDTTDFKKLAKLFPTMSTVSVAKIELPNGNPDELIIFFNIPGGLPVAVSPTPGPRQKFLQSLLKKFTSQTEDQ